VDGVEGRLIAPAPVGGDGLQVEAVLPRGNHSEGNGRVARAAIEVLRFEPGTKPGVANFRLAHPEIGVEAALDEQVVKVQFNHVDVSGEIAADVTGPDLDTDVRMSLALRFDDHKYLPSDSFEVRPTSCDEAVRIQADEASLRSGLALRVVQRRKSARVFLI
jgi:hypothetical protein